MPGFGPIPEDLVQRVVDQYDTAVANLDEQIGVLLDRLREMGLYDNTMIILTSDHGEYFGEHYLVEHSKDVFQEAVWVPLIIKEPRQRRGKRDDTIISSSDMPYLIWSQFPEQTAEKYRGQFPNAPGNHPVISENYYSRAKDLFNPVWGKRFDRIRIAIYDWPYKYIHSTDGRPELYHLEYDGREAVNLVQKDPKRARRMLAELRNYMESRPTFQEFIKQAPLSDEELKKLKSLGYVGN